MPLCCAFVIFVLSGSKKPLRLGISSENLVTFSVHFRCGDDSISLTVYMLKLH